MKNIGAVQAVTVEIPKNKEMAPRVLAVLNSKLSKLQKRS